MDTFAFEMLNIVLAISRRICCLGISEHVPLSIVRAEAGLRLWLAQVLLPCMIAITLDSTYAN
jgi:hypothetical protein